MWAPLIISYSAPPGLRVGTSSHCERRARKSGQATKIKLKPKSDGQEYPSHINRPQFLGRWLVGRIFYEGFKPAENALPAVAVAGGGFEVAGETFLADADQGAGAGFLGTAGM